MQPTRWFLGSRSKQRGLAEVVKSNSRLGKTEWPWKGPKQGWLCSRVGGGCLFEAGGWTLRLLLPGKLCNGSSEGQSNFSVLSAVAKRAVRQFLSTETGCSLQKLGERKKGLAGVSAPPPRPAPRVFSPPLPFGRGAAWAPFDRCPHPQTRSLERKASTANCF